MKRTWWPVAASLAAAVALSGVCGAQRKAATPLTAPQRKAPTPEELEQRYEKKLEKEFVTKVAWKQVLDEAISEARTRDAVILGYFTRSYSR